MVAVYKHKIRIKIIKYAFMILGVIAIYFLYSMSVEKRYSIERSNKLEEDRMPDISEIDGDNIDQSLVINHSIFQGFSKDFSPYKIIARKVKKISQDYYQLNNINANYILKEGNLKVKALEGEFDSDENILVLKDQIKIDLDDISLNTEKLSIDINEKDIYTNEKVQLDYKDSSITADSLKTEDSSNVLKFQGNVKSRINVSDF